MTVLSAESSAKAASCAVTKDGILLGEYYLNSGFTHSKTLLPMIDQLLSTLSIPPSDIDLLAVNRGPGSFTGIRIGVAAIKGLSFSCGAKCVGVSTLDSLCYNIPSYEGLICPVMDARVGQVYNALFERRGGVLTRLCADRAITVKDLEEELCALSSPFLLVGDGAGLCAGSFSQSLSGRAQLAPESLRLSRASSVAAAAVAGLGSIYEAVDGALLSCGYLRPSQAERERAAKLENKIKE